MKGYCSVADVENYTLTEVDSVFEPNVQFWIGAVETIIERQTGRVFIADSEASKRYFDGNGLPELHIDECVAITGLKIVDDMGNTVYDLTENTHYFSEPYNELPKRKLASKSYNVLGFSRFLKGQRNVELTAKWGFSIEVPEPIKFATVVLVAGIMNFGNDANGEIKSEKIGDYQVTYKDDQWRDFEIAKEVIGNYTKHNV